MRVLVNSNPNLEEITADTWEGGIKISPKDKVLLQQKNIKLIEESSIPDSDIDSDEESDEWSDNSEDGVDIEDSDEDLSSENSDGSGEEDLSSENSDVSGEEDSSDVDGSENSEEGDLVAHFDEEENLVSEDNEEGGDAGVGPNSGGIEEKAYDLQVLMRALFSFFAICFLLLCAWQTSS